MKKFLSSVLAVLLLIVCLSIPAFADAQLSYVTDDAGILYDSDISALEERAAAVSEQYGCGVYIVTVEDFTDYSDAYYVDDFGEELFSSYDLGLGDGNCGILLILSMAERDYGLVAHGDFANTAFTDYGKDALAEYFLDDFRNDDWYQGFADYIDGCAEFMRRAADLLVSVTAVNAELDVQLDGLVELGLAGADNKIQSLHGIIECLLIDELCALFIIFTSKQFVFLLIMWLSRMD